MNNILNHVRGTLSDTIDINLIPFEVDLGSTLQIFSNQNFEVHNYIKSKSLHQTVNKCQEHKIELKKRSNLVSSALQNYVYSHSKDYAQVFTEMAKIEGQISQLHNLFIQYHTEIHNMAEWKQKPSPNILNPDETPNNKNFSPKTDNPEIDISMYIEEKAEEIKSVFFQRNYTKIIQIYQETQKYLSSLDSSIQQNSQVANSIRSYQLSLSAVVEHLILDLQSINHSYSEKKIICQQLTLLQHTNAAVLIFLQNQSLMVKSNIRKVKISGNIFHFIDEVSSMVFDTIRLTAQDYLSIFPSYNPAALVVWAREEIIQYGDLFIRQVLSLNEKVATVISCLSITFKNCQTLDPLGLSFTFLLFNIFENPIIEFIKKHFNYLQNDLLKSIQNEEWKISQLYARERKSSLPVPDISSSSSTPTNSSLTISIQQLNVTPTHQPVYLTLSLQLFYHISQELFVDIKGFYNIWSNVNLYSTFLNGILSLFNTYLNSLANVITSKLTETQYIAIISNHYCIIQDLMPRIMQKLKKQYIISSIPQIDSIHSATEIVYQSIIKQFTNERCYHIVNNLVNWPNILSQYYANDSGLKPANQIDQIILSPSPHIINSINYIIYLNEILESSTGTHPMIFNTILSEMFSIILNKTLPNIILSTFAVVKCWFDFEYFYFIFQKYFNQKAILDFQHFIQVFLTFHQFEPNSQIRYKEIIQDTIKNLQPKIL